MTTAIKNPIYCTRCERVISADRLVEVMLDNGYARNYEDRILPDYMDVCPCGHEEFERVIICFECDEYPCQCEENDDDYGKD